MTGYAPDAAGLGPMGRIPVVGKPVDPQVVLGILAAWFPEAGRHRR